jgi:hypothetical protein
MAKLPQPPKDPDEPKTTWDNIIFSTPVVLTVIATVLAGLSSSQMSQAQYYRSMAAEMQSKVGDQWAYFQAKRLRSNDDQNVLNLMAGGSENEPSDAPAQDRLPEVDRLISAMRQAQASMGAPQSSDAILKKAQSVAESLNQAATRPDVQTAIDSYSSGKAPELVDQPIGDPAVEDMINDIGAQTSDAQILEKVGRVKQPQIDRALGIAQQNSGAFDAATSQITASALEIQKNLNHLATLAETFADSIARQSQQTAQPALDDLRTQIKSLRSEISQAQLRFDVNRLNRESGYNQALAQVMEVQVRMNDYLSDRSRRRSKEFFLGMLGAQAGVTVGTMSLAARKRRWLWFAAAAAGLFAVIYAGYVYLFG